MNNNDIYDSYGILKTIPWPDIKSGDKVIYLDKKKINNAVKTIELVGIWDGQKVEFDDVDKTIVRTIRWLKKI